MSWLGDALAEATKIGQAVPVLARPASRPSNPSRDLVVDRRVLPTSVPGITTRSLRPLGSAYPVKKVELKVPERLVSLLLAPPYSAVKHAQSLGVGALLDPFPDDDMAGNRLMTLHGESDALAQTRELIERMILDLSRRHGIINKTLENKYQEEESKSVPALGKEPVLSTVRVRLGGHEVEVMVDKEKGPHWYKSFNGHFGYGEWGNSKWKGKDWTDMTTTEREVLLLTTASRQSKLGTLLGRDPRYP
mmetsp:Transcript_22971/g.52560  ORF Transcript_22971/g.52560 Transcript_22971/m.52560 type:complete len:248 (+) Transcript_22971:73-816(+)